MSVASIAVDRIVFAQTPSLVKKQPHQSFDLAELPPSSPKFPTLHPTQLFEGDWVSGEIGAVADVDGQGQELA